MATMVAYLTWESSASATSQASRFVRPGWPFILVPSRHKLLYRQAGCQLPSFNSSFNEARKQLKVFPTHHFMNMIVANLLVRNSGKFFSDQATPTSKTLTSWLDDCDNPMVHGGKTQLRNLKDSRTRNLWDLDSGTFGTSRPHRESHCQLSPEQGPGGSQHMNIYEPWLAESWKL